jgi:hypothetical protein
MGKPYFLTATTWTFLIVVYWFWTCVPDELLDLETRLKCVELAKELEEKMVEYQKKLEEKNSTI